MGDMRKSTTGWIIALAAFGMMAGLIGADLIQLMKLGEVATPSFLGNVLLHIASVITAFVGGKLIPESRDSTLRTRSGDEEKK